MNNTLEKIEFLQSDLAPKDQFLVDFLNINKKEFSGVLPITIMNINNIPVQIELQEAISNGHSLIGYIPRDEYIKIHEIIGGGNDAETQSLG